jgi:hypothetical protein
MEEDMQTLRIPALEKQLAYVLSTAKDIEAVDFTINEMYKIILRLMEENEKLRREK